MLTAETAGFHCPPAERERAKEREIEREREREKGV
jgi:hypothetical protein